MNNSPTVEVYDRTVPSAASVDVADKSESILNAAKRTQSLASYATADIATALLAAEFDGVSDAQPFVVHLRVELLRRADAARADKENEGIIQGKDIDYDLPEDQPDGEFPAIL